MTNRPDDAPASDDGLSQLSAALAGDVIRPADPEYDTARVCFNALVERRPAAIARCLGPADIATAFDFARTHELEVAVRGGGHNPAGHCMLDGGLVIDLSLLRAVEVDEDDRLRKRRVDPPGSTSIRPRKRSASSPLAGSSAPRACAGWPSAAGSVI